MPGHGNTQPGHAYLRPENHASKGISPQEHMGGGGVGHNFSNKNMNDIGHKSMKLGGGGRFAAMVASGKSPALAAFLGRKKYGASKMEKWAAAGRKRG